MFDNERRLVELVTQLSAEVVQRDELLHVGKTLVAAKIDALMSPPLSANNGAACGPENEFRLVHLASELSPAVPQRDELLRLAKAIISEKVDSLMTQSLYRGDTKAGLLSASQSVSQSSASNHSQPMSSSSSSSPSYSSSSLSSSPSQSLSAPLSTLPPYPSSLSSSSSSAAASFSSPLLLRLRLLLALFFFFVCPLIVRSS